MSQNKLELIKELRQRTNSALGDVKKALEATDYNIEAAIKWLKENGIVKAAKKSGRLASEGVVSAHGTPTQSLLLEVNSETDFVAQNEKFMTLVKNVTESVFKAEASTLEEALQVKVSDSETVEQALTDATAVIGEKITLRRVLASKAKEGHVLGTYLHANNRVAAVVEVTGSNSEVAKNVAMHLAAMNPEFVLVSDIPEDRMQEIKKAFETPKDFDKKPAQIQERILSGWLDKQLGEVVLEKQPFVMEDSLTVAKYLANANAKLVSAHRYEVGEGLEKVQSNFAEEVASMTK
ncbi:translation elongation factor Ts [Mycoplasmopsis synoviae]|uniref:translation elongation factor Ts n=1 Tax=Mycoplasmopsis synoviae TaxID=2109 RepID=UPI001CE1BFD8|nr:translation elongation factor Ts [Mycoplasmopsis synoviae]UBX97383.1 translation elongation factor Ts [Mycoplasmopsis synoviae]UBX98071.1 translation elongation factor Ts [Mycoplasmopsis synoviae]UBX99007.1 translation elongation factor Ts [Mycoplasmopsis synoviae]UBX99233.1 translation elongation factor Ts [Mycoplasmopsis synoviae]UBY00173.1 translation elongation factor Ts [Mycoplasmopsis synoviae]